ncbi:MAG: cupin domain-containing protein [Cellulomonadaceae bacterium]|nr:cupin domain-containing protein [Cellulomonadaceae bacterium]
MAFAPINILDLPSRPMDAEQTDVLLSDGGVRVERIVSSGQTTDWYDQAETEFVALISGQAVIEYADGETVTLAAGDTLLIEPHEKHRVAYTSANPPCIWLCVFYG